MKYQFAHLNCSAKRRKQIFSDIRLFEQTIHKHRLQDFFSLQLKFVLFHLANFFLTELLTLKKRKLQIY